MTARGAVAAMTAVAGRIDATTLRFLVTGSSGAALFFVLSVAVVSAGLPPFIGTLVAYGIAFVVVYTAQHAWTFKGQSRHGEAFPRYLTVQVGCALFSALLARLLSAKGGLSPAPMSAITTVVQSAMSYTLARYWVFSSSLD